MQKGKTTIADNPANIAVLIDPRSGKVIGEGSTPTQIIADRQAKGVSLTKAPKEKKKTKEELMEELEAIKRQLNKM